MVVQHEGLPRSPFRDLTGSIFNNTSVSYGRNDTKTTHASADDVAHTALASHVMKRDIFMVRGANSPAKALSSGTLSSAALTDASRCGENVQVIVQGSVDDHFSRALQEVDRSKTKRRSMSSLSTLFDADNFRPAGIIKKRRVSEPMPISRLPLRERKLPASFWAPRNARRLDGCSDWHLSPDSGNAHVVRRLDSECFSSSSEDDATSQERGQEGILADFGDSCLGFDPVSVDDCESLLSAANVALPSVPLCLSSDLPTLCLEDLLTFDCAIDL
eukprot:Opistho-2@71642